MTESSLSASREEKPAQSLRPLSCPPWCVDVNRHAPQDLALGARGELAGRWVRSHSGPMFGPFSTGGESDIHSGDVLVSVHLDEVRLELVDLDDPMALRRLAVEAAETAGWLEDQQAPSAQAASTNPHETDVDVVRGLLDLMADFSDNDQRARYLLSSNWLRDRGAAAAERIGARR